MKRLPCISTQHFNRRSGFLDTCFKPRKAVVVEAGNRSGLLGNARRNYVAADRFAAACCEQ
jgi:hypothetical protein